MPAVSASFIQRISSGEFVNFESLLPFSGGESPSVVSVSLGKLSEQEGFGHYIGDTSLLISHQRKGKSRISYVRYSFLAWSVFFSTMYLAHELVKYQNTITRFFTQFSFNNVINYDVQFCQKMAINRHLSWSRVDEETYNLTRRGNNHPRL